MDEDDYVDDYDDYVDQALDNFPETDSMEDRVCKRDYGGPASVIEALVKEWLSVTVGSVPVFGWPLDDQVAAYFKGHIAPEEHAGIVNAVLRFFDGDEKACIFPVMNVVIHNVADSTRVTVIGDRSRAQEMLPRIR